MALTVYSEDYRYRINVSHCTLKKDRFMMQLKTGYRRVVLLHVMIQFHKQT